MAFLHLSAPALFAPFVRLELLRWEPLWNAAATSAAANGAAAGAWRTVAADSLFVALPTSAAANGATAGAFPQRSGCCSDE